MPRLRWFDPEPDELSTPIDWRFAALIIATLFLNFAFWMDEGADLWMSCSLPLYTVIVAAAAVMIPALFFVGPALATQAAKRPLLGIIENSLGSIPAHAVRFCCILFLAIWLAKLMFWPGWVLMRFVSGREVSTAESSAVSAGILIFVIVTSTQGPRTTARLAFFTDGLGLAILIAALIRVHRGWPDIWKGSPISSVYSEGFEFWRGFCTLAFGVAPLALFAASFGYRSRSRKVVAMTALMGLAGPLTLTLLLTGVIAVATLHSGFYTPSITPQVAMALWGRAAGSALPPRILIAAITMLGAMRFGFRALFDFVPTRTVRRRWTTAVAACLIETFLCLVIHDNPIIDQFFEILSSLLAVLAAVLTVDFTVRSWHLERAQRFDVVGIAALVIGLAAPFAVDKTQGAPLWLLPSYAAAFLSCLLGRAIQKFRLTTALE